MAADAQHPTDAARRDDGESPPRPFRLGHQPALDGLRGVACLMVVWYHLLIPRLGRACPGGWLALDSFFVLSGFLITALLLQEWDRSGAISLWRFYSRRALRLLPALYAYLLAMLAFAYLGAARPQEILGSAGLHSPLSAMLYYSNWVAIARGEDSLGSLILTWSLSVEEQFYIVWAVAVALVLARGGGRRGLLWVLLAGVVLSTATVAVVWRGYLARGEWMRGVTRCFQGSDTRASQILIGCALGAAVSGRMLRVPRGALRVGAVVSVALVLYLSTVDIHPWRGRTQPNWQAQFYFHGGNAVLALAFAVLILALMHGEPRFLARFFSFRPFVAVGRISYGVYLWHPSAFFVTEAVLRPMLSFRRSPVSSVVISVVVETLVAVAAGAISHVAIERPFLKLKTRMAPRGRADGGGGAGEASGGDDAQRDAA